jgi:protein CpxP
MENRSSLKALLPLAASVAICLAATGVSTAAYSADPVPVPATARHIAIHAKVAQTAEGRIKHLHDQLEITSDQESQWQSVAQVMLDNANAVDSAIKDRVHIRSGMTAVDDLRSYEAVVDAHAEGIKKLAIAFKPMYDAMPEEQQKNADAVFGHRTSPSRLKTHA